MKNGGKWKQPNRNIVFLLSLQGISENNRIEGWMLRVFYVLLIYLLHHRWKEVLKNVLNVKFNGSLSTPGTGEEN